MMTTVKVFGTLIDSEGNVQSNKKITFRWVNEKNMPVLGFTEDGVIVTKSEEVTDDSGYFETFLVPNNPPPDATFYQFEVKLDTSYDYPNMRRKTIYLDGVETEVDLSGLLMSEPVQVPDTPVIDTLYVLNAKSDGTRVWEVLPPGNSNGDVLWSQIDANMDGVVDNAEKVNNKTVELDVTNVLVSQLEASDDFDNA